MIKRRLFAALLSFSLIFSNGISVAAEENIEITIATPEDAEIDETPYDSYANNYLDTGDRIDYYVDGSISLYQNSAMPSSYDSRNYGYITSVKDQGSDGTCWAFSALGAGESTLIKNGYYSKSNIDLSELQLAYFFYNRSVDPLGNISDDYVTIRNGKSFLDIGGNNYYTLFALASWKGAASESSVPYGNASVNMTLANKYAYESDIVHLQNSYIVSMENTDEVKKLIMNYGAVASAMYNYSNSSYYKKIDDHNWAYCQNNTSSSNHGIMVIGWDDNYSVDNFSTTCKPDNPGAWLIKNSWGDGNTDYIWISYEDASLSTQDAFVYIFEKADNYDFNYQYDGGYAHYVMKVDSGSSFANVYTAKGSNVERLDAVSIALADDNISYKVQIYYNPDSGNPMSGEPLLSTPQTGTTTYAGYYTIKLNNPVLLAKGDRFSVVFTLYDDYDGDVKMFLDGDQSTTSLAFENYAEAGQSYKISASNNQSADLITAKDSNGSTHDYCARIKAFTTKASSVDLSSCTISSIGNQVYTGSAIKPVPTITYGGKTLTNGSDYTLSYSNNTAIGTGTLTITGKGRFSGTKTINFNIRVNNYQTVYNGVDYSAVYDYNYYVIKYADIWKTYGTDTSKALEHFVNYGMKEGRQANENFNVYYYKNRYTDLRNAYGTDLTKYYTHYINYGKKEGRDAKTYCAAPATSTTTTTTTATTPSNTTTTTTNQNTGSTTNVSTGTTVLNGIDYSAVYNYNYYINKYADIKNAYGSNDKKALEHFVNYGMKEGRQAKEEFNVNYYRNRYADLRSAYGTELPKYYMHYINYGKKEGRDAKTACTLQGGVTTLNGVNYSAVYDYNYYISKYPDIKKAYGGDDVKVLQHFVNYGMNEGRQGNENFNVTYYKNRYGDLRKAFGNNRKNYYLHYIKNGKKEGRDAKTPCTTIQGATTVYNGVDYSAVYDYNYYIQKNADVNKAFGGDENAVLKHFVNYGMKEGRQAKATFNVKYYKSNYKDLQKAFGSNLKLYYTHYINNGKKEGRTADKLLGE